MRYEALLGFNTKQWWVYDNYTDEYCDPPTKVLNQIGDYSRDVNEQKSFFDGILATEPEWLNDEEYRYYAAGIDI